MHVTKQMSTLEQRTLYKPACRNSPLHLTQTVHWLHRFHRCCHLQKQTNYSVFHFEEFKYLQTFKDTIKAIAITHILELLVSTIVGDFLAQIDQDMVSCVICRSQQLLHLPPPLFISHLVILQDSQHFICSSTQNIPWLLKENKANLLCS